jgi:hypothetical protein
MGDPTVSNGLALCKLHHSDFDGHILGVRPDLVVEIREDILREKDVRCSSTASKASRVPRSSSRPAETFSPTVISWPNATKSSGRRFDVELAGELVDGRTIPRFGDWLARLASCREPVGLGSFDFRESLFRSVAEGGASEKVRNVSDVAAILLAPKDVDVVVLHDSSSNRRL